MKQSTVPVIVITLLSVGLSAFLILEFLNYFIPETENNYAPIIAQVEANTKLGSHTPEPPIQNPLLGVNNTPISAGTITTTQRHIKGMAFVIRAKNEV